MNVEPSRFFVPKRHIRVSSPSGGRDTSDILNTSDQASPARKVRDNQKSSIVNTGVGVDTNGNLKRSSLSPRRQENTKNRLFGSGDISNGSQLSPRRCNDTWRSNILFSNAAGSQTALDGAKRTPKKQFTCKGLNPITGSPMRSQSNGCTPIHTNGVTNGFKYDHDDMLTIVLGSNGKGPVAALNGHGNGWTSHRPNSAKIFNNSQ